jgi:hypothetical protein
MGFGYLVLGFLVWLNPVYSGFTEWLAYTLILSGASKLAPYGKGYRYTPFVGIPGLILAFANFVLCGADLLGFFEYQSSAIYGVIMLTLMICTIATRILLLWGTFEITTETGLDNQKYRSVYCMLLYSLAFVFDFLQTIRIIPATSTGYAVLMFAYLIIGGLAFFLHFACLRMITLGDEDEMPPVKEDKIKGFWQKIKDYSDENSK